MRLFQDCTDFSDVSRDGWNIVSGLAYDCVLYKENGNTIAVFNQALSLFCHDMKENFIESGFSNTLSKILDSRDVSCLFNLLKWSPEGAIDSFFMDGLNSLLRLTMDGSCGPFVTKLLRWGANPNCVSQRATRIPGLESPTSLAMYSSSTFIAWQHSLHQAGIETEIFLDREIAEGPLAKTGWTRATLEKVFDQIIIDIPHQEYYRECDHCSREADGLKVQPFWLSLLYKMKHGKVPREKGWGIHLISKHEISPDRKFLISRGVTLQENSSDFLREAEASI